MADINLQLLPETRKRIEIHSKGENTYLIVGLVFAILVGGVYAGAYFYHSSVISQIQSVDSNLQSLEDNRDKAAEQNLLTLNKKLNVVGTMIAGHFYWTDGLIKIEKLVQPQVQFKSLSAEATSKKISFKAEAGSYSIVAKQIAAFLSDPSFTNIVVGKVLSLTTGRVEFSMQFDFDPNKVLVRTP